MLNDYEAPEGRRCLYGVREGDNQPIQTSSICKIDGKLVHTSNGSIYELGEPAAEYLVWMKEQGIQYDPEQPIKTRQSAEELHQVRSVFSLN